MRIGLDISQTTSSKQTFTLQGSQKKKRRKETENLLEEIIAKNFPNVGKETDIQVQAQGVPRRSIPRHIIIKMSEVKDEERLLMAAREKQKKTYEENQ